MTPEQWRRIESIYNEALECDPSRRNEYVANACADDAQLRRDVEALLEQGDSPNSPLEKPILDRQHFGPYTVIEKLGAGGMGEVFKAFDKRLNRTVAIKVLKAPFSDRFIREARAIAALNHPRICTLYDVGEDYLVMEYVEGKPLKGPLPLDQALRFTDQICDALDAAHRAGIVHRDLKPSNILVAKQGIKLVDFGIARIIAAEETLTGTGNLAGTPAYMAPEVLKGAPADARSDIYSLGCVVQEIVTGSRAAPQTLDPPALDRVVRTCRSEDPDDRWQSAREVKLVLEAVQQPSAAPRQGRRYWRAGATVVLVALAGVAGWLLGPSSKQPATTTRRFEIATGVQHPVISPNGRRVAYVRESKLWIRDLDRLQPREVTGSEGARSLFWSPDSAQLGFASELRLLRKVAAAGGSPVTLTTLPDDVFGAAWSPRDTIIVATYQLGLFEVPAAGGQASALLKPDGPRELDFHSPQFLPDGAVLCVTHSPDGSEYRIIAIKGGSRTTIFEVSGNVLQSPIYLPTGHVMFNYASEPGLWAISVEPGSWRPSGPVFKVDESGSLPSLSSDGSLVSLTGTQDRRKLVIVDRSWKVLQSSAATFHYMYELAVSPDGRRVAASATVAAPANSDIWMFDLERNTEQRFTFDPVGERNPAWSPSGDRIAYSRGQDIAVKRIDGSREEEILVRGQTGRVSGLRWAPRGDFLLFQTPGRPGFDTSSVPLTSGVPPTVILKNSSLLSFSPDGGFFAYASRESGRMEVYVRPFPTGEGKWVVSTNTGRTPRWSPKGDEIFYLQGNDVMAAKVELRPGFRVRGVEKVSTGVAPLEYDVMPDGKRFITTQPASAAVNSVVFVENWLDEVWRKR